MAEIEPQGPTAADIAAMIAAASISTGDVLQIATSPSSGTTVSTNNNTTIMLIDNPGLLLALTIPLPATPANLQRFTVAANAAITAMTITGGTVRGLLAGLSAGGFMTLRYSAVLGLWFRTA